MYFTAQASHLSHLSAKLGAAVDEAMSLTDARRVALIGEALARRFPSDIMISKYREVWQQVSHSWEFQSLLYCWQRCPHCSGLHIGLSRRPACGHPHQLVDEIANKI